MTDRRHIVLVGYRGAGKTTVGRLLAAELARPFIDTDALIVQVTGRKIARIFADGGEAEFRREEAGAIARAVLAPPAVIAAGGGALEDRANIDLLKCCGRIVWLKADPAVLRERILNDPHTGSDRPPLEGASAVDEIEALLARREPLYQKSADIVVDASGHMPEELVAEIRTRLGALTDEG
jgi:shikimate kinase